MAATQVVPPEQRTATSAVIDPTMIKEKRGGLRWSRILGGIVVLVLLVVFAAPLHRELRFPILPQDEGLLLVYPTQVLAGAIPNHNFESVYGILNIWFIAAGFKIAGASVAVERTIGILYRAVVVGSVVTIVWRRQGPLVALFAGGISTILMTGTLGLAAYAWFGGLAFLSLGVLFLDVGIRGSLRPAYLLVSGISLGLAIGMRLDLAVAALLFLVAAALTYRSSLKFLAIGAAIGLSPLYVNIIQAGLASVVRDQVLNPVFVSGPSRRLSLDSLTWHNQALLWLCVLAAIGSIAVGVMARWGFSASAHRDAAFLLPCGAIELGLLPETFQRSDTLHLALVACFVLPLSLLVPSSLLRVASSTRSAKVWPPVIFAALLVGLAAPFFGSTYWSEATAAFVSEPQHNVGNDHRTVPVDSAQQQAALQALLRRLDGMASPGQRVFVGPLDLRTANYNDTYIYFLLPDLTPGSYYLEMNPGEANGRASRLASDLKADDYLILTSSYDLARDPDPARDSGRMPQTRSSRPSSG